MLVVECVPYIPRSNVLPSLRVYCIQPLFLSYSTSLLVQGHQLLVQPSMCRIYPPTHVHLTNIQLDGGNGVSSLVGDCIGHGGISFSEVLSGGFDSNYVVRPTIRSQPTVREVSPELHPNVAQGALCGV